MVSIPRFEELLLAFDEVIEQPHFDKRAFKVGNKIFVTLNEKEQQLSVRLSQKEQSIFTLIDKSIIYPVANKWGKQGWTVVNLKTVPKALLQELLVAAYCAVAPKRLSKNFIQCREE